MKHILVTGAKGHLGRRLTERLAARGDRVTAQVRGDGVRFSPAPSRIARGDLADAAVVQDATHNVQLAVHCAARIRDGSPEAFYRDNVQSTRHLVSRVHDGHLHRLVYISTVAVYGQRPHHLTREAAPIEPRGPYAESKAQAEALVQTLGLKGVILRPGVIWGGPHDTARVGKLARRLKTRTCVLPGPCDRPGPLVHVDNLCDAIIAALEVSDLGPGVFNVVDWPPISLRDFARRLATHRGLPQPLGALPAGLVLAGVGAMEALRDRFAPRLPLILRRDTVALMNAECTFDIAQARRWLGYTPTPREHLQAEPSDDG